MLGFVPAAIVLEEGDGDRREAENAWMVAMRAAGLALRNRAEPHLGRQVHCASTRELISRQQTGRPKPAGHGDAVSAALRGKPRPWSSEGRARVAATQFKPGENTFAALPHETQEQVREKARRRWDGTPAEERSRAATARNEAAWARRTADERAAVGAKISAGRMAAPPALRSQRASAAARAAVDKPGGRERLGAQVRGWWASLTPEARDAYLAKRTAALRAAKAAKRAGNV